MFWGKYKYNDTTTIDANLSCDLIEDKMISSKYPHGMGDPSI